MIKDINPVRAMTSDPSHELVGDRIIQAYQEAVRARAIRGAEDPGELAFRLSPFQTDAE
jgi:hypothetical protein